jgi:hypothetical protein
MLHPRSLTVGAKKMTNAQDIIEGIGKVIEKAHNSSLKIYVSKLTPFKGFGKLLPGIDDFKWSQEAQDIVDGVNQWIDTCPADGVIRPDFIIDENDPQKMKAEYAIDFLHYKPEAQKLFVECIDEDFLK